MNNHNFLYTFDGVFVCGSNDYGQLGLGDKKHRLTPTKLKFFKDLEIKSIHCGGRHTIINTTNGLFVFGKNNFGQLGLGDNNNRLVPTKLEFFSTLEIISIHCGFDHTMINTTDGLYVFGDNNCGQLGLGDNNGRSVPTKLEFFSALEIISISCGCDYTIINTIDGLFVFGYNDCGQLGLGYTKNKNVPTKLKFTQEIISISCGFDYTIINTTEGLFVFGYNINGKLGLGDAINRHIPTKLKFEHEIISIHCGFDHTLIHTTEGLFVFGLGDSINRYEPTKLKFFNNSLEIISIHCGQWYTIINTNDGLFVFGDNSNNNLGLGDDVDKCEPTKFNFNHEIISLNKRKQIKSSISFNS